MTSIAGVRGVLEDCGLVERDYQDKEGKWHGLSFRVAVLKPVEGE